MVTRVEKKTASGQPQGTIGRLASSFLKNRPRRILLPKASTVEEMAKQTEQQRKNLPTIIPKITNEKLEEIEIQPIKEPFSFVRILYNRDLNEYIYEVIEPQLSLEESRVLDFLMKAMIKTMEYHFDESTVKEKEDYIKNHIRQLLKKIGLGLNEVTLQKVTYYMIRDFVGYGPIDVLMTDELIEDISCDGPGIPLFIYHKKYESMRSNIVFKNDAELDSFVISLAQKCGKHISVAEPMLDATIPDGSRLQATLAREVTTRGSSFTIRRFRANPFTPPDLLRVKTMSAEMLAYLWLAVEQGESIVVCGGTASGKTSTLNAILLFIPPAMKIITIEDTREINLPHENWIAGLTRSGFGARGPNGKLAGEIDMYDLLRAALRQRPQYLIVGEVRGIETYTMFQAMATGHTVFSTMHADSVKSMVYRLENPPINLPRILLSSLNIVVIQAQVKVGKGIARRIRSIVEIVGIEQETNELITNTVYVWNSADDNFTYNGHSFLFERIMSMKNMTTSQMKEEFKRRVEIIEWMGKANVRNYIEVASIISAYYKDPEATIKKVRSELYGT
ncbi:MAG: type II/IV secretion system ATPase subunit [Thermoplasmata archaeon]